MSERANYSDELINAFVDHELGERERAELLAAAAVSSELSQRICQAQRLKEMVSAAYSESERGDRPTSNPISVWSGYAAAAVLGALSMSLLITPDDPQRSLSRQAGAVLESAAQQGSIQPASRVVFHISSNDPVSAAEMFDQVELILEDFAANQRPVRVEILANNQGLRILQLGHSPFAQRVADLDARYQNIVFAACGNTLERIRKETGESIDVLPQAVIVRSGVSFVARRQQQGWAYIKV